MKIGDIAVRIGSYAGADGQQKGRYEIVGTVFKGDDGSLFGTLKSVFDYPTIHQLQRADDRARGRALKDGIAFTVFEDKDKSNANPTHADPEDVPF